ncbi:MAG: aminotransferase class I/II-fold pyridoxal phosphate-dependent enzyme [Saprospiraceae bacterium]|nr:aminotransferase class I/II-fold pyridoxal phosphate-dependent enzyme [Saprospiraceae bacterium]
MDLNDILVHHAEDRKNYFNAVAPPIIQSSNFVFDSIDDLRSKISDEINHHVYTRGNNPTVQILRKKVAELEHAEDALITSSGSAAVAIAVLAHLSAGDHVVSVAKPYSWTTKLITQLLHRFGVSHDFVDATNVDNIRSAIQKNTKVLMLESPNSLTFECQDLEACSKLAKEYNIITVIDNSYSSPIFQNPIDFGIDLVVHSGTKYINGHSDVVMGVVCGSKELITKIFYSEFMTLGVNISPNDAAMAIRGLRTLNLRVQRSDETATKVKEFLHSHPKVKDVIHPFSDDFPQNELAKKQMRGCGGLFTINLNVTKKSQVYQFVNAIEKFHIAVSWGGYESLIIPSIAFHDVPGVEDSPIPWTFIRFYIGLEDADYLITDIQQALNAIE